jgi:hypothetical protein
MATFKDMHGEAKLSTSKEPFIYHGEELTDERAEQIAQESLAEARRRNLVPGGKSMSGGRKHSPVVQFRVPESMEEALEAQAEREGVTRSRLARKALDEYLERHAG